MLVNESNWKSVERRRAQRSFSRDGAIRSGTCDGLSATRFGCLLKRAWTSPLAGNQVSFAGTSAIVSEPNPSDSAETSINTRDPIDGIRPPPQIVTHGGVLLGGHDCLVRRGRLNLRHDANRGNSLVVFKRSIARISFDDSQRAESTGSAIHPSAWLKFRRRQLTAVWSIPRVQNRSRCLRFAPRGPNPSNLHDRIHRADGCVPG